MADAWQWTYDNLELASKVVETALSELLATEEGRAAIEVVAAPGLVLLDTLGITPAPDWRLLAAILAGWFFWVRFTRALYFALGRRMGFAGLAQFSGWLRLWLPWQGTYRAYLEVRRFLRQRGFGDGPNQRWAGFWELAAHPFDAAKGWIPVGRLPLWQRIGLHMPVGLPDGDKHIAVISYAGGGKTAWIQTWLGVLPRHASAFVFDMDGAMANAFGPVLERAGHKVVKLDADNIAKGFERAGKWNPIGGELTRAAERHGPGAVVAFAEQLANALIVDDSKQQPVFARVARTILKVLILYVHLVEKDKTLLRVRELLTRGMPEKIEHQKETPFGRMIFEMSEIGTPREDGTVFDDGAGGAICKAIANGCGLISQARGPAGESLDHFMKTAQYQTAWLDDPNIAKVIDGDSDIYGEELKLTNAVVFFVSTLTDTHSRLAPLVRAFTMMTLYAFERTHPEMKLKTPCAFFLDEFPNLGRMDAVAIAAPGYRKFGVRLVTVSQSLGLLRATYPERYMEFLNQAEAVIWMGISQTDRETLTYLSKEVLGEHMRKEKIDGYHWMLRAIARGFGVKLPPARYQRVARRLMTEQQCAAFLDRATGQVIVTREGRAPMRLKRLLYWLDLPVWSYEVHKGHGERFLRAMTRRVVETLGFSGSTRET